MGENVEKVPLLKTWMNPHPLSFPQLIMLNIFLTRRGEGESERKRKTMGERERDKDGERDLHKDRIKGTQIKTNGDKKLSIG